MRQDRMQYGLDRRRRRACAQHVRVELVDHARVGQRREIRELAHVTERNRREACRLYGFQIPAAAFDVEYVLVLAKEILFAELDRGVAAAMQHERFVAAEQA